MRRALLFLRDDGAQGLTEFALIIALVAIVGMIALNALGNKGGNSLQNASNQLS
ncbi:MAG: Flp family type IVb pilin [Candidatus Eremiobacteraeota bacterium]|nr:Flp family type IVb pilin [Candidatus Eremiobacteraeota bacterium]MBC5809750.1 Flp family type IVb pilin [Candidatus Eremiobacteraeota bacterium]